MSPSLLQAPLAHQIPHEAQPLRVKFAFPDEHLVIRVVGAWRAERLGLIVLWDLGPMELDWFH